MEEILDAIRRIIARWTVTTTQLTADAFAGDTHLKVRSSIRFQPGDEFLVRNGNEDTEQQLYVASVPDETTITLVDPLRFDWMVGDDAAIVKTINNQFVQAVFIGEPDVITTFPAITVNGTGRSSEWYTIRATKEHFNIEIGVFVQDATHEDGYRFLLKTTDLIQKGLKKNIYPLVNNYNSTSLLNDIVPGDKTIRLADTSFLVCGNFILVENGFYDEPNTIVKIIDANTVEVATEFSHSFVSTDTTVIKPNRYIYNSWPAEIQYGKIHKGTLLKAAVINFFVEETEVQGEGGFEDTQLS